MHDPRHSVHRVLKCPLRTNVGDVNNLSPDPPSYRSHNMENECTEYFLATGPSRPLAARFCPRNLARVSKQ